MTVIHPKVINGIDVLEGSGFESIAGKRVGLVTNHTGKTTDGRSTVDVLCQAPNVTVTALFGPEHGIRGVQDEAVDDGIDVKSGLPVYSLYGARTKPTEDQCRNIDVFVYDIQDIGCRFYTYLSTLGNVLEAAQDLEKAVIVLDRPNPIGGRVAGPYPDSNRLSFTAYHRIPVRHGLSLGELARLIHAERGLQCHLEVVSVQGWSRMQWFDETNLTWINPSPNMRSLYAALLYPGIGLLEFTNISVGRGTDRPFELVGAPYIDGVSLAESLNERNIAGIRAMPVNFTPTSSVYSGELCSGVMFTVTDRDVLDPIELGFELARLLVRHYPKAYDTEKLDTLLVNDRIHRALMECDDFEETKNLYVDDCGDFERRCTPLRLYP